MKSWLLNYLACQECGGELCESEAIERREEEVWTGTLECLECQLLWPVLGGVPFLLQDPGEYLARYRESILSTLVEFDSASQEALQLIDDFAQPHQVELLRFADDWTPEEAGEEVALLEVESDAMDALASLRDIERGEGLNSSLLDMLQVAAPYDALVEIGPRAGGLSQKLAGISRTLILIDLSLRSLLRAKLRASASSAQVACILGDVAYLELGADRIAAVVAANIVDRIEEPEHFLSSVCRWLVPHGELLVSSTNPSLGTESDDFLGELLEAFNYRIEDSRDGIPWLRTHSPRHAQIYWVRALRASI